LILVFSISEVVALSKVELQANELDASKAVLRAMFRRDPSRGQRSPMDFFGGRARARDVNVTLPKRTRGNFSTRHSATETRTGKVEHKALIDERYADGRLFAQLAMLNSKHIIFIRAVYMTAGRAQYVYQQRATRVLHQEYLDSIDKKLRMKTKSAIKKMAEMYLECMRAPLFAVAMKVKPWEMFQVDPECWKKSYKYHWLAVTKLGNKALDESVMSFFINGR
jgi:hypothetical protein